MIMIMIIFYKSQVKSYKFNNKPQLYLITIKGYVWYEKIFKMMFRSYSFAN